MVMAMAVVVVKCIDFVGKKMTKKVSKIPIQSLNHIEKKNNNRSRNQENGHYG